MQNKEMSSIKVVVNVYNIGIIALICYCNTIKLKNIQCDIHLTVAYVRYGNVLIIT